MRPVEKLVERSGTRLLWPSFRAPCSSHSLWFSIVGAIHRSYRRRDHPSDLQCDAQTIRTYERVVSQSESDHAIGSRLLKPVTDPIRHRVIGRFSGPLRLAVGKERGIQQTRRNPGQNGKSECSRKTAALVAGCRGAKPQWVRRTWRGHRAQCASQMGFISPSNVDHERGKPGAPGK
jgi:hypothetical protein